MAARVFLVLGSAALYAAALQTSAGPLLGWLALAPFLAACATATPRRAFALGILLGLATTVSVAWWFPGLVARFFGSSPALGWLALGIVGVTADGLPTRRSSAPGSPGAHGATRSVRWRSAPASRCASWRAHR